MEIVRLPEGEQAPRDSDCISLQQLPDGQVRLEASALHRDGEGDEATEGESVALVDGGTYASLEEAEAAGTAWADEQGVERLVISLNA